MTIPRGCKRLAEVDFPIAAVSRHAVREKSIRRGHPSTLHLWWARRPLASSRAVLLGLLWPDPCDALCPPTFKEAARALLPPIPHCHPGESDESLQAALLRFIADFASWKLAAHPDYLRVGRALVKAAHGEEAPLVVDPFAGGGPIPLEALRLGCEAFASDLNPVACLILKVMLEDIPRRGPALADELRKAGAEIRDAAAWELADLYPADADGAVPIAYLWARTVRCEAPRCGAEIPLMRSFWLARKPGRKRALRCRIERPEGAPPRVVLEVFEPKAESEVRGGTVTRAKATCPCCDAVLPPERVQAQLAERRGGADAVFACIGPALEIFSRCRAVETAEGREVGLAEYLEKVWEVVGRAALARVLGAAEAGSDAPSALEEDARLTALFLWTHQSTEAIGANGDEENEAAARGLALPFDVVRRFAQPMGIDLARWTGRIVGQSKGVVRLLPVADRARDLFGAAGAGAAAGWIEADPAGGLQGSLFPELDGAPKPPPRRRTGRIAADADAEAGNRAATVLDRVHGAMLLQAGGHTNARRASIKAEQERGPDFLRLANALSALYPRGGPEKRLLDAMLLAAPR